MPTLNWLTRDDDLKTAGRAPYRLLEAEPALSAGDPRSPNMLIQGDNLEALKSLLPYYRGRVRCVYIDPPYNTRSAFEHYDDNLEHAQWLAMIYPRLELLRELLSENGSIWVSIDDNEGHYLKVVMDEVFGRRNFVANIVWQKRTSRENRAAIGSSHDDILVYAKVPPVEWKAYRNTFAATNTGFSNPDNDPHGEWRSIPFSAQGFRANQMYEITLPSGRVVTPPRGRCWGGVRETFDRYVAEGRVWFGRNGDAQPTIKRYRGEEGGLTPMTLWPAADNGDNTEAKREILVLFDDDDPFGTPKPERLMSNILTVATNPGDLVLDSFLGSGTTAAVAHKMGRRWIGVEMGDHAVTHCAPRLMKVIDGEQGGVSEAVGWKGGGGFTFHRLGEAVFDEEGRIKPGIGFASLAAHVWFSETGTPFPSGAARGTAEGGGGAVATDDSVESAYATLSASAPVDTPLHHASHGPPPRAKLGEDQGSGPFLGVHDSQGYALLYNGVLGDRRPQGGNVLTNATLAIIRKAAGGFAGPMTIYGEASRLGPARLRDEAIVFKQTPYDVRAR